MRRGRLPKEDAVVGGKEASAPHQVSSDKRPLIQQPPFPYNNPLLFVIPSEGEGSAVLLLPNQVRLSSPSPLFSHPQPPPTRIC